jgi:hypothetical protein
LGKTEPRCPESQFALARPPSCWLPARFGVQRSRATFSLHDGGHELVADSAKHATTFDRDQRAGRGPEIGDASWGIGIAGALRAIRSFSTVAYALRSACRWPIIRCAKEYGVQVRGSASGSIRPCNDHELRLSY